MAFEREGALAAQLAHEAGTLASQYRERGVEAEDKADASPVTAADRACEKLIVERLIQEFPEDGILGEEGTNRETRNGRRWIIDPIDGTKDYIRGIPLWSVLIGFERDGEVTAGAAYCPGQRLLLSAAKGAGAWANQKHLSVSGISEPRRAVLSFNGFNKAGVTHLAPRLLDWVGHFWSVRCLGGAVDAMLLAQGQADVWIEPNAAPWDLAPLKILVEEAGGVFASFEGKNTIYGGNAYACAPGLEGFVRTLLDLR